MSDHENPPEDLLDAVSRLDDIAEWLREKEYDESAAAIDAVSAELKSYIVIRLTPYLDSKAAGNQRDPAAPRAPDGGTK